MFALSRCLRPTNFPVATISPHCIVKAGTAHDRVFVVPSLFGSETAQLLSDPVFEDSVKFVESCSTRPAAVDRCSQSSAGMACNFSPACTRHPRTHPASRQPRQRNIQNTNICALLPAHRRPAKHGHQMVAQPIRCHTRHLLRWWRTVRDLIELSVRTCTASATRMSAAPFP